MSKLFPCQLWVPFCSLEQSQECCKFLTWECWRLLMEVLPPPPLWGWGDMYPFPCWEDNPGGDDIVDLWSALLSCHESDQACWDAIFLYTRLDVSWKLGWPSYITSVLLLICFYRLENGSWIAPHILDQNSLPAWPFRSDTEDEYGDAVDDGDRIEDNAVGSSLDMSLTTDVLCCPVMSQTVCLSRIISVWWIFC